MDDAVRDYIEAIDPGRRVLFDRIHRLILATHPDATVRISYGIPTYQRGRRRLYLGVWQHGVSLYGWPRDRDGGFAERHPELLSGRGTIRLRPADAAGVTDDELRALVDAALTTDGDT